MALSDDDISQIKERTHWEHLPNFERIPASERPKVRACFYDRNTLLEEVERLRVEIANQRQDLEETTTNNSRLWRLLDEARDTIKALGDFAVEALGTDGGHHKQYYLQTIARLAGVSSEECEQYDKGIAP